MVSDAALPSAQNIDAQKLVEDLQTLGSVVKDSTKKTVQLLGRQYEEINQKHPGFGEVLAKIGLIVGTTLSFLLRPLSTTFGFGVGLVFPKDVKALMGKVNEWFKTASPFIKGLAVAGAVIGLVFTPIFGGFATGAYSGQKVAEWLEARNRAQET